MPDTVNDRRYVIYSDDLETPSPEEGEDIERIVRALHGNSEYAFRRYHRGLRDAHAKSHGILRGELIVPNGLPPELAQGLFARPARYPVIARFSTTSGALRSDRTRGIRGFAVKAIGVHGPRCEDDGAVTQDLLFVTHSRFPFADARAYRVRGMPLAWLLARVPDPALHAVSAVLSGLRRCGLRLPIALDLFAHPNEHLLGMSFFTAAALRYGDHVARMRVTPSSPEVKALIGTSPVSRGPDAFRDDLVAFFARRGAEYEIAVQLCTDTETMPIEDAGVDWPEDRSPYRAVATLAFGPQDPCGAERMAYGDDVLAFTPWRGLAAHRPLGSINRLKVRAYEESSRYRHQVNHVEIVEPASVDELPQ